MARAKAISGAAMPVVTTALRTAATSGVTKPVAMKPAVMTSGGDFWGEEAVGRV